VSKILQTDKQVDNYMSVIFREKNDLGLNNEELKEAFGRILTNTMECPASNVYLEGSTIFSLCLAYLLRILNNLWNPKNGERDRLDLVIFVSRKSWGVYCAMRPFLISHYEENKEEYGADFDFKTNIEAKVTNDNMISVWLNANPYDEDTIANLRVAVVDDSCVRGNALGSCIRRLYHDFGIGSRSAKTNTFGDIVVDNITAFALVVAESREDAWRFEKDNEGNRIVRIDKRYKSDRFNKNRPRLCVRWGGPNEFPFWPLKTTQCVSKKIVEILAISSVPYVGFSCGFVFDLKDAVKFLGEGLGEDLGENIEQEDLFGDFADSKLYEFYNTTSISLYENRVQSFVLFLKDDNSLLERDYLPKGKDAVKCMRVYINYEFSKLMILPLVIAGHINNPVDIINFFPESLQHMFGRRTPEDQAAAYRLYSFATGFVWGKCLINQIAKHDGVEDLVCEIIPMVGLHSKELFGEYLGSKSSRKDNNNFKFFDWLNSDNISDDLIKIENKIHGVLKPAEIPDFDSRKIRRIFHKKYNKCFAENNLIFFAQRAARFFMDLMVATDKVLDDEKRWRRIRVPLHIFTEEMKKKYDLSINKVYAIVCYLCDGGQANMIVGFDRNNHVFQYLAPGEQAYHAVYYSDPSYAYFLQKLIDFFGDEDIKSKNFNDIKGRIKKHFREENKSKNEIKLLLENLDAIKRAKNRTTFCAEPKQKRFDESYLFFKYLLDDLLEK
jgi:hypothetical protein